MGNLELLALAARASRKDLQLFDALAMRAADPMEVRVKAIC